MLAAKSLRKKSSMKVINSYRVNLDKHIVALSISKFSTFYKTRRFITVFTRVSILCVKLGFDVVNINLRNMYINVISYGRRAALMVAYFMLKKASDRSEAMYYNVTMGSIRVTIVAVEKKSVGLPHILSLCSQTWESNRQCARVISLYARCPEVQYFFFTLS